MRTWNETKARPDDHGRGTALVSRRLWLRWQEGLAWRPCWVGHGRMECGQGRWRTWVGMIVLLLGTTWGAQAQLFSNLESFGVRLDAGDPDLAATNSLDGPKGMATADFDGDGRPDLAISNTDGSVTVYYSRGDGKFSPPTHLHTGVEELRGIACGDLTGDGAPDILVAAPYVGQMFLFANDGGRFESSQMIETWPGARNLAIGDFDGDGMQDLVVAGTTNGVRHMHSMGVGAFETVTNITSLGALNDEFPKPVYSFGVYRLAGSNRDEVVVTHADSQEISVLAANEDGVLQIQAQFTGENLHALALGGITQPAASGQIDLVTASRDFGEIEVHRGTNSPIRFSPTSTQRFQVPGGPRALVIADMNGDGWNDVMVVLRNFDRVLTYRNNNGSLEPTTEMPVGRSPREIVSGDFNDDGRPDAAVMNRDSMDVSVLITYPGEVSFGASDQIYPVDGEVTGLAVFDFNRDGRDDVVQLHRASAEFSVRLAETNGLLGDPTFYSMGALPSAQAAVDVNNDGITDLVTANLGSYGFEPGSVSVRLGDGMGGFGPEQRYYLPEEARGSLFALVAGDFDKDGAIDLAAGFFDCRIAFFKGNGMGGFTFTRAHLFVYEARVMVAGDFDQDGDLDLAGAGYAGHVVVIENKGDLLTTLELKRDDYPPPSPDKFGTRDIVTADVNGDEDLDLLVGSGNGMMLFIGGPGMRFDRISDKLPGTEFPVAGVAIGDFDGQGTREVAVACQVLSCITILSQGAGGEYAPVLSVDVPSGTYLATGDLDGDGLDDLVGTGGVLWTALSSRPPQPRPAPLLEVDRQEIAGPVINELLAVNDRLPLELDDGRMSDWVELYNGAANSFSLNGWRLRLSAGGPGGTTNVYTFPPTAFFSSKAHVVIVFSEIRRTLYHTGFRLPGEGSLLELVRPSGEVADTVRYPAQQENVSFGRYRDGLRALVFNPYPNPGRANQDNGPVEPVLELQGISPMPPRPGEPIRFFANGRDDVGIVGVSLRWQRLDVPDNEVHRIILYDDGQNGDGGLQDGLFSGLLDPGWPAGAEVQFYVEVTDLSDQRIILPDEPIFARPGQTVNLFNMAVGGALPSIEISEVVAWNSSGLEDGTNGTPDWVEIRNCSATATPLRGVALASKFFGNSSRLAFGDDDMLAPGEPRIIFCDGLPGLGPMHAPFGLNRVGDQVLLTALAPNGTRLVADSVNFGPQEPDVALARIGCGGPWRSYEPTPLAANAVYPIEALASREQGTFTVVYPTEEGFSYVVEATDSLTQPDWTSKQELLGDGIEKVLTEPIAQQRFFRIRKTEL